MKDDAVNPREPMSIGEWRKDMRVPYTQLICSRLGEDFESRMIAYIREHFSDLLGDRASLLDSPDGLNKLASFLNGKRLQAVSTAFQEA
jgi:hypothetical protein